MFPAYLCEVVDSVDMTVRVVTRSSHPGIAGERAGALVVRVKAPPVEDRANRELIRILAHALDVPPTSLDLVRGATSANKVVRVPGLLPTQVAQRLETGA